MSIRLSEMYLPDLTSIIRRNFVLVSYFQKIIIIIMSSLRGRDRTFESLSCHYVYAKAVHVPDITFSDSEH